MALLAPGSWAKLLALAGLAVDPGDATALFRRLALSGAGALRGGGGGAGGGAGGAALSQATFVAFASRTDDEVRAIVLSWGTP